jgi:hypothetical protein
MARARAVDNVDDAPAGAKLDAYTGMLMVAFLATLVALLFVFLDFKDYPPEKPNIKAPAAPTAGK